jgi:hypothetical protein
MPKGDNLTQEIRAKGWVKPGEVRNPNGKPKGTKDLSTHIKNLLTDPELVLEYKKGKHKKKLEGMPVKALIKVAIIKAMEGDPRFLEWLAKYGFGSKITHDGEFTVNKNMSEEELDAIIRRATGSETSPGNKT